MLICLLIYLIDFSLTDVGKGNKSSCISLGNSNRFIIHECLE